MIASVKERIITDTDEQNQERIVGLSALIRDLSIELDSRLNQDSTTSTARNAVPIVSSGFRPLGLKAGNTIRITNKYGGLLDKTGTITKTTQTGAWLELDNNSKRVFKRASNLMKVK